MSTKHPLYDVVIAMKIASQYEADELARILTHDDGPPIIAVMCDVAPDDTRWKITVSIGVKAPDSVSAIIRAAKFTRRCCRQLGFGAYLAAQITVGPSTLNTAPAPIAGGVEP